VTVRRAGALVAGGAAAALLLVGAGEWERSRHADEANAGIEQVRAAVGDLDDDPAGFRMLERFQCLVYERGGREFALELCADWDGRVVEAIDRRDGVRIWSLREDPTRADVVVDRAEFERIIVAMCDQCRDIFRRAREPGGQALRRFTSSVRLSATSARNTPRSGMAKRASTWWVPITTV
jgi:hypothetical protein